MPRFFTRATRAVALLLTVLILATTLVACGAARPISPSKQDKTVVATCAGYDICYDELRYVTLSFKDEFEARYGDDIWTDADQTAKYLPQLTEEVTEAIKIGPAILDMSHEFGIKLDDSDIQDGVQAEMESMIDQLGGRKVYLQMIDEMYMTDHFVRYTIGTDLCESQLVQALITAGLIIGTEADYLVYAMDDEVMCATYQILIQNDPGDDIEANRALAEEVLGKIRSGTELTSLIGSIYNEDVLAPAKPYYFMKGEYDEAYEKTAFALPIGETSGIIETDDGFYIIERQELDPAYITTNLHELYQRYQYAEVEGLLREHRTSLTVEWTDEGKDIDLLDIE